MFAFLVLRSYSEASVTFRNMPTRAQSVKVWESFTPFAIHGRGDKQIVNMVSMMTGMGIRR